MLSSEDQDWSNSLIAHTLANVEKSENEYPGYDWSVDIATECYLKALSDTTRPNPNTTEEELKQIVAAAMDRAIEYWSYICDALDSQYDDFHCQKWGIISTMLTITGGSLHDPHNKALHSYLTEQASKKYKDLFNVEYQHEGYEPLTDLEIEEYVGNVDTNLLKEFFETFEDLQTFHGNALSYDDEEQKKKQRKLLAIYEKLFRTKED